METQGATVSFNGGLVFFGFLVLLVVLYKISVGERGKAVLLALIGFGMLAVLMFAGGDLGTLMDTPPISTSIDLFVLAVFLFVMYDGIRGIRRNGLKPWALVVFVAVLVLLVAGLASAWNSGGPAHRF